ncbi:DEAD/DEAH box helicase family protein [Chryseobacterium manosquense]|uniref:DEAD/DEAH box helicase family protein n=1 Tax=Chryseobacterium manosquense TaxID=2754694 RepID=A0A7H1DVA3_9FLAO|nr:DEAD/DEAH box helicase family protein [Chryseobacterium manosquense]QNS40911.1 DEAD/DEAH box helicase family protein [Chryseobacterium manosquense]
MPDDTTQGNISDLFIGFPIDYFKIKPEDLNEKAFGGKDGADANARNEAYENRITASIIQPDREGKVYDELSRKIDLDKKDTTVINIGVGQGKTYTILKTVEKYLENPDTYIIIAVPYVSLVNQYFKELITNGIPEDEIYRYEWLNPKEFPKCTLEYQLKRRVHIVTVNCLLGNAGDNAAINSKIKREYLKGFPEALIKTKYLYDGKPINEEDIKKRLDLIKIGRLGAPKAKMAFDVSKVTAVTESSKNVVFIFDEIHDAIHNFSPENILYLYFWKNVLQKIYLLSATYNDASLVVINKLSELTEGKINIIEAERVQIPAKLSKLYIHYDNASKFGKRKIKTLVEMALHQGKEIDILCFSKSFAEELYKGEVGALLKEGDPDKVKLCVSELIQNQRTTTEEPKNRYDENKINIGTNFKTGINIEKENHFFIIIMPPRSTKMVFENKYGIFSGGYIDLVQAVARQRKVGEIHIVTMHPDFFTFGDQMPQMTDEQFEQFETSYRQIQKISPQTSEQIDQYGIPALGHDSIARYCPVNYQKELITDQLKEVIKYLLNPVMDKNVLVQDFKDNYRLTTGKLQLLRNKFLYSDIAANLTVNAFMNQFINCKLETFNFVKTDFADDTFPDQIHEMFDEFFQEQNPSFSKFYNHIRDEISSQLLTYNGSEVGIGDDMFMKKLASNILSKYYPLSGVSANENFSAQHIIHLIMKYDYPDMADLKAQVTNQLRAIQSITENHRDALYLPSQREDWPLDNAYALHNLLVENFPVLKHADIWKDSVVKPEDSQQNIEKKRKRAQKDIFNTFKKVFGDLVGARHQNFAGKRMHKVISQNYPL